MTPPRAAPGSFARTVQDSFPPAVRLPEAIVAALDWLEDNGHVVTTSRGSYAPLLSPAERAAGARGQAGAVFHPSFGEFGHYWLRADDPRVVGRLASFVETGGDGSGAGIWIDDAGLQQFVHLGSGSGSVWSNIITDDPVDFLRLLAVGYDELCWPEDHELTPEQAYASGKGMGEGSLEGWVAPTAFRTWLRATFDVTVPTTAREIVPTPDDDDGNREGDAFGRWLALGR